MGDDSCSAEDLDRDLVIVTVRLKGVVHNELAD